MKVKQEHRDLIPTCKAHYNSRSDYCCHRKAIDGAGSSLAVAILHVLLQDAAVLQQSCPDAPDGPGKAVVGWQEMGWTVGETELIKRRLGNGKVVS